MITERSAALESPRANSTGEAFESAAFKVRTDEWVGSSLDLKFKGLSPAENHEREIRSKLLELMDFAPYKSHLIVQIRKTHRVYSLHAQLNSMAGRFFARAFDPNLMSCVSQLIDALQERIDDWRSTRECPNPRSSPTRGRLRRRPIAQSLEA